uniref:Uncharacterized protein n=1 Tax=viral metagenome TaxID=1070528 RepID=A0A6C0B257_9ZZZZ
MIPEWKDLRKKAKKVKVLDEAYFALANEYVDLKSKFECADMLETFMLWFDMVLYPIYIVIQLCMLDMSPMYIMALLKTYKIWVDWFRLREIEKKVDSWKTTVRSLGGPWISSNDPDLHVFVYADGMERIKYSRVAPRPSRKTEKTSPKVERPVQ